MSINVQYSVFSKRLDVFLDAGSPHCNRAAQIIEHNRSAFAGTRCFLQLLYYIQSLFTIEMVAQFI